MQSRTTQPRHQEEKEAIVSQLAEESTIHGIATDLAIAADKSTKQVTLPDKYKQYMSVFSEDKAQQFLLSHPWDHAIEFKKEAPDTIDCKIYPMTPAEDAALDKFIDEQLAKGYI